MLMNAFVNQDSIKMVQEIVNVFIQFNQECLSSCSEC